MAPFKLRTMRNGESHQLCPSLFARELDSQQKYPSGQESNGSVEVHSP